MVRLLRDTQASETLPVLVHCSAGCGRTGTICAIDYVWGLLRNGKLTKDFSLLSLVRKMRRQRIAMVQTKEQYVLVHQAVRELFKEQLNMIDSHPYENIDSNGMLRFKEEPLYDVIGNFKEKQDDKKEKEIIPHLPQKREPVLCSKQKKEVQNFTARQKLIDYGDLKNEEHSFPTAGSGNVSKIKKLKSQFELYCDIPANNSVKKLSVLTCKSNDGVLPIPSRGVLKVPQLERQYSNSKSSSLIKRSKSLKILSSEERLISNEIPIDTKQISGLESNLDENCDSWVITDCGASYGSFRCTKESKDCSHVCQIVKGYEALSSATNRRPLRRSYTTLDMRQKPFSHKQSQTGIDLNIDSTLVPKKNSSFSRSQTQLEFWRVANKNSLLKDNDILNKGIYSSKLHSNETSSSTVHKLTRTDVRQSYEVNFVHERSECVSQVSDDKPPQKCSKITGPVRAPNSFQPLCMSTSKKIKDRIKKVDSSMSQDSQQEEFAQTSLCDPHINVDYSKFRHSSNHQRSFLPEPANEPQIQHMFRTLSEDKKMISSNPTENIPAIPMKHKYSKHVPSYWAPHSQIPYSSIETEKSPINPNKIVPNPIYTNTNFVKDIGARNSKKPIGFTRSPNKPKTVLQSAVNHKTVNHHSYTQSHFDGHNTSHSSQIKTSRIGIHSSRNAQQCHQNAKIVNKSDKECNPVHVCLPNCPDHRKGLRYNRPKNADGVDEKLYLLNHKLEHTNLPCSSSIEGKSVIGGEVMNCMGQEFCRVGKFAYCIFFKYIYFKLFVITLSLLTF
ncbi:hypothetical protein AAG570_012961 [Ranatra chinensis]|uniref:protein-tyrosine-phosphatase n=1 Tax=Ranatra chinensis TaxID=642074 RepID=A0ABD0YXU2_9HEMI